MIFRYARQNFWDKPTAMFKNFDEAERKISQKDDVWKTVNRLLKEFGIQMTAMESTDSFWKPIFNILEVEGIPAILVNAQEVKNLQGRKTDVKDAEGFADLLWHGLLKPSFLKPRDQLELCRTFFFSTYKKPLNNKG